MFLSAREQEIILKKDSIVSFFGPPVPAAGRSALCFPVIAPERKYKNRGKCQAFYPVAGEAGFPE